MTKEELKKRLELLLTDELKKADSSMDYYALYADVYMTIFRFCFENDIVIEGYDLKKLFEELIDLSSRKAKLIEACDKIVFFFQQIADEMEAGTLRNSEEFKEIFAIYFELNEFRYWGVRYDPKTK